MTKKYRPSKNDFWFLPLGGSGEIGMNLNLYGHAGQWLMIDLGITFGDRFGIEVITPDPAFILERREDLVGLVLTHAHEDHLGAVPYLWPMLRCPIYATPFTAHVVRQKISEFHWAKEVNIIEVPLSSKMTVGAFEVEFITLTHSIPEPNALAITTPLGTVIHTGDWKIDPAPLIGKQTDQAKLIEWGNKGVLALVCDSTNVFTEGVSGSEEAVRNELINLIGKYPKNRLVVACFASNVARLETAAVAAKVHGRKVALVGRSLQKMYDCAKAAGYLQDLDAFIDEETAMKLPGEQVLLISTGSQGEHRSALARMATDQHPEIDLEAGDIVIFSSRMIPGNEKAISQMQNNLVRKGVKIITAHEEDIHVSGHPAREELKQMYAWVRPQVLIPVHGEMRHMQEQAELALSCGVPKVVVPENGTLIQIDADQPAIIDYLASGRLGVDGNRLVPMMGILTHDRARLAVNGVVFVSVMVDRHQQVTRTPQITLLGVSIGGEEKDDLERDIHRAIRQCLNKTLPDQDVLREELRVAVRRAVNSAVAKKPMTEIHLMQQ
jgi:ribonuclease J